MWGAFHECLSIGEKLIHYYWLVPININYNRVSILPLLIRWGLCVPRSCESSDLEYFLTNTFLQDRVNETHLNITANYDDVKITTNKSTPLNSGAIAMIIVCGLFIVLALVGSVVEMGDKNMPRKIEHFFLDHNQEEFSESSPLIRTNISASFKKSFEYKTAFSLFKNNYYTQLPTAITSLNGIQVMSMFWIIVHHTKEESLLASLPRPCPSLPVLNQEVGPPQVGVVNESH